MTNTLLNEIMTAFATIRLTDVIDILLVTFLFYKLLTVIRSTRASRIAKAIVLFLLATWVTSIGRLNTLNFILSRILELGFIALVIMFQPELRRLLERLGSRTIRELVVAEEERSLDHAIRAVVTACESMSKSRTGALIVFERKILLDDFFKTGTVLDAAVSDELLRNIFFPKASLHDGAVIIRQDRIAAAGCVLPLSENQHLSSDLGTRHRAGIGMSEASDAVVVVVSEETGTISVAIGGMLKRHLAARTLERLLQTELESETGEKKPTTLYGRLRSHFGKKEKANEK